MLAKLTSICLYLSVGGGIELIVRVVYLVVT